MRRVVVDAAELQKGWLRLQEVKFRVMHGPPYASLPSESSILHISSNKINLSHDTLQLS